MGHEVRTSDHLHRHREPQSASKLSESGFLFQEDTFFLIREDTLVARPLWGVNKKQEEYCAFEICLVI